MRGPNSRAERGRRESSLRGRGEGVGVSKMGWGGVGASTHLGETREASGLGVLGQKANLLGCVVTESRSRGSCQVNSKRGRSDLQGL